MNTENIIQQKINNAKVLDFGTIFNQSIELFKKTWDKGLVHQLLMMVLMLPFMLVFYVPYIVLIFSEAQNGYIDPEIFETYFAGFTIGYLIFFILGMLIIVSVSIALNAALYRVIKMIDHNESVVFNDFFYFFKGKYFSKFIGLMIISILIAIPATLLCYLPVFYVMVPLSYFTVIFAFNPELSVGQIVSLSFKIGNKKWLLSFGLMIVCSFLASIVGFLLCGIGVFFTAAFIYHPNLLYL